MKTKILTIGILITFFAFVSCEKENTKMTQDVLELNDKSELNDEVILKSLKSSSSKKIKLESYQNILQPICGEVHTFELWYYQDFAYGAVTVSNDAEFLYIQYDLNEDMIEKGWGFDATHLFIGDYNNLEYLENGININWQAGNVVIETYEGNPVSVSRILELKNLPECFGIATKVRISNSDGGKAYPRAFLNIEQEFKYPWLEGYNTAFRIVVEIPLGQEHRVIGEIIPAHGLWMQLLLEVLHTLRRRLLTLWMLQEKVIKPLICLNNWYQLN